MKLTSFGNRRNHRKQDLVDRVDVLICLMPVITVLILLKERELCNDEGIWEATAPLAFMVNFSL